MSTGSLCKSVLVLIVIVSIVAFVIKHRAILITVVVLIVAAAIIGVVVHKCRARPPAINPRTPPVDSPRLQSQVAPAPAPQIFPIQLPATSPPQTRSPPYNPPIELHLPTPPPPSRAQVQPMSPRERTREVSNLMLGRHRSEMDGSDSQDSQAQIRELQRRITELRGQATQPNTSTDSGNTIEPPPYSLDGRDGP